MLAAFSGWPHLRSSPKPSHRSNTKSHTMRNIALIQARRRMKEHPDGLWCSTDVRTMLPAIEPGPNSGQRARAKPNQSRSLKNLSVSASLCDIAICGDQFVVNWRLYRRAAHNSSGRTVQATCPRCSSACFVTWTGTTRTSDHYAL